MRVFKNNFLKNGFTCNENEKYNDGFEYLFIYDEPQDETFDLDTFYDSYEKIPGQENDEFEYNYTEIINFINNYKVEPIKIGRPKVVK